MQKSPLRYLHPFILKSDLIYNMNHMRIQVLCPYQWYLSKQSSFKKLKSDAQKNQNKPGNIIVNIPG